MKDGLRFVDSDMHIMEPPDLFDRYLDPKFKDRISVPIGADGRPKRGAAGLTIIDGLPTSDMDLQQYRKRVRNSGPQSTQPLSGSRLFDTGRLDFAVARDYDPVAQVMGMEMEGVDIAVNYPTAGLALLGRDNMDPQMSLAISQAYNHWIEMQQALIAMIIGGVFEFHPRLRVGYLEAQNSWVPGLLSRIEWDYPQYRDSHAPYLALTPREYFRRNCWAAVEGSESEIEATARLIGADRMCISTDYPHFDSNFPHVSTNLLKNVPREIAAQIFMGGAHLYAFDERHFREAAQAADRQLGGVAAGG